MSVRIFYLEIKYRYYINKQRRAKKHIIKTEKHKKSIRKIPKKKNRFTHISKDKYFHRKNIFFDIFFILF